ncbi:MAG: 3-phosphoshikimate 1-carboxyvinyltransferase [Trueperaceae bacterium]|nr:3-phosphoshikimate 1-carboxyvinyltransferase [Trueperaceae bacterium]
MLSYPDALTVSPKPPLNKDLAVPGSKSLTNRAFVVAALADGVSTLRGGLIAEDSEVMIAALKNLGFTLDISADSYTVHGQGGKIPAPKANLDLRLSGTSIRFLTAMVALGQGTYILDGNERMRERPIQDLLTSLEHLGVKTGTQFETGCPPVIVEATGLEGGETSIAGDRSSQYLSALLMAAPYAKSVVTINVTGELQSKPFIDMTLKLMKDFGVEVARDGYATFTIKPAVYRALDYLVEGDAMAAGYFWAAAALTGGRIKVTNIGSESIQGDKRLANVLEHMGCQVNWTATTCEVIGPEAGKLRGGMFDLNDMPDQAQTLAVLGLFADSPVRINNVWNMRIKETDRLAAVHTELKKFGAEVEEGHDYLIIHPLKTYAGKVEVDTYGDHRMAMAFALAGLRLPGVTIKDPSCVAKTFPEFFDVLESL